ncbi:hypothetical protein TNCV_949211 [Trichonephila clavipes]|nr:hypothetical protein TNCV_949211 [Trichonephila clavipes]
MIYRHLCTHLHQKGGDKAPVFQAASRVASVMVSEIRVRAATNVVDLYVKTLVVLQTTPILESGLDPLRRRHNKFSPDKNFQMEFGVLKTG